MESLAQLGVQLLLFRLGLELSPTKLRAVFGVAVGGGTLQVLAAALLGSVGALLAGAPLGQVGVDVTDMEYGIWNWPASTSMIEICPPVVIDQRVKDSPQATGQSSGYRTGERPTRLVSHAQEQTCIPY